MSKYHSLTPHRPGHPVLSVWAHRFLSSRNGRKLEYVPGRFGPDPELNGFLAYYRYLNAHGKNTASTVFLFVGKSVPCMSDPKLTSHSGNYGRRKERVVLLHAPCRLFGSQRRPRINRNKNV